MSDFNFNLYQQIYCLSSAANAVGGMYGTEKALQIAEQEALRKELPTIDSGNWTLAWGPRVYKNDPTDPNTAPGNVWYCAVNRVRKVCVMAMAGTAYGSIYDWLLNAEVKSVVDFNAWTPSWMKGVSMPEPATVTDPNDNRALLAWGTATFTTTILSKPSPQGAVLPGNLVGQFLMEFQQLNPDYTIVFTGHSMGGAVCPAIALGLVQSKMLRNTNKNVWVVASAGPTPGSATFNAQFKATFPASNGSGYRVHNVDYWNTNDVVPQAWSTTTTDDRVLTNILQIYSSATPKFQLEILIPAIYAATKIPFINYHPLEGRSFTGGPVTQKVDTIAEFEASCQEEHSPEYWKSIGIEAWYNQFNKRLLIQPGVQPSKPKAFDDAAVIAENKKILEADQVDVEAFMARISKNAAAADTKKPAQVEVKPLATV